MVTEFEYQDLENEGCQGECAMSGDCKDCREAREIEKDREFDEMVALGYKGEI